MIIQCCTVEMFKEEQKRWRTVSSWNLGDSEELKSAIAKEGFGLWGWPNDSSEIVSGTIDPSRKLFTAAELPLYFDVYGVMYASMLSSLRPLTGRQVRILMYRYQE